MNKNIYVILQSIKAPRFVQRHSGRLILIAAASLVLAFVYPVTYWSLSYAQSLQKDILTKEYNQLHIKKVTTEATMKNRNADLEKTKTLLVEEEKNYKDKKTTLVKIHEVKVNYLMKAKILTLLTKDLNRYKVSLESLEFSEKEKSNYFTLDLVSYKAIRITKLISYLTSIYDGKYRFSIQKIYFDDNENRYLGQLKVEVL